MVQVGKYNTLKVNRKVEFGVYLDDGNEGILLPKRCLPKDINIGDEITVFLYHDSDNRLIATTEKPKAIIGEIVLLNCVSTINAGAFLDWGLMKDLFVAKSQQLNLMHVGNSYLVKLYIDEQTGRIAATEKINRLLSNETLTVQEFQQVELVAYRKTELGFVMIINNLHLGLLHHNEIFQEINVGDKLIGCIKAIRPDNKIDLILGKMGYQKVEDETEKIIRLLKENNNFLPFHDKSNPDDIYNFFGMSKKTFKMSIGALYKLRKIDFKTEGIELTQP